MHLKFFPSVNIYNISIPINVIRTIISNDVSSFFWTISFYFLTVDTHIRHEVLIHIIIFHSNQFSAHI